MAKPTLSSPVGIYAVTISAPTGSTVVNLCPLSRTATTPRWKKVSTSPSKLSVPPVVVTWYREAKSRTTLRTLTRLRSHRSQKTQAIAPYRLTEILAHYHSVADLDRLGEDKYFFYIEQSSEAGNCYRAIRT